MRLVTGLVLASAIAARADTKPEPTWADWTGDYKGAVRWTGCTVAGQSSPALAIEFTDGVASIDLAALRAGLPTVTLIEEEKGWAARHGDLAFSIARGKPDAINISLEFETGCIARGALTRIITPVPACTKLASWARIEARCSKESGKLEDAVKIAATKWKPADAAQCTARADKVALALVDAGCAPHPDPAIGTRARECLGAVQQAAALGRCSAMPKILRDSAMASARSSLAAAQTADKNSLQYVERECVDLKASMTAMAAKYSCPP